MSTHAVEIVYRGIFQAILAKKRIPNNIVFAARAAGRTGISYSRYGDSPERNGIPAKTFAVVSDSDDEMEANLAKYEADASDVIMVCDDTMVKGIESWAWYGTQPINRSLKANGTVLVVSRKSHDELLRHIPRKDFKWRLAIIPGDASFAGLWIHKEDGTDMRFLGAMCKVCPEIVSLDVMLQTIRERLGERHAEWVREGYETVQVREVQPGEGKDEEFVEMPKPGWTQMREGIIVEGIPFGERNPYFKKWSTRTRRPVINFETCIKCTLCWLHCPDSCFDVTEDGYFDANYEACCGCGVCADVCPVEDTIVMVNELQFDNLASSYEKWKGVKPKYRISGGVA